MTEIKNSKDFSGADSNYAATLTALQQSNSRVADLLKSYESVSRTFPPDFSTELLKKTIEDAPSIDLSQMVVSDPLLDHFEEENLLITDILNTGMDNVEASIELERQKMKDRLELLIGRLRETKRREEQLRETLIIKMKETSGLQKAKVRLMERKVSIKTMQREIFVKNEFIQMRETHPDLHNDALIQLMYAHAQKTIEGNFALIHTHNDEIGELHSVRNHLHDEIQTQHNHLIELLQTLFMENGKPRAGATITVEEGPCDSAALSITENTFTSADAETSRRSAEPRDGALTIQFTPPNDVMTTKPIEFSSAQRVVSYSRPHTRESVISTTPTDSRVSTAATGKSDSPMPAAVAGTATDEEPARFISGSVTPVPETTGPGISGEGGDVLTDEALCHHARVAQLQRTLLDSFLEGETRLRENADMSDQVRLLEGRYV